jgi:CBS domain-containing protein
LTAREKEGRTRVAARFHTEGTAAFESGDIQGRGVVQDISVTGALIEPASPQLPPGATLRLRCVLQGGLTVDLRGRAVRETEGGFAVEFTHVPGPLKKLLRLLTRQAQMGGAQVPVEHVMTRKLITVGPDCPATEVLNKLYGYGISCVMVSEEDTPIGIITERDIVGVAFDYASGKGNARTTALELMSPSLTTVSATATLDEAIALTEEHRIRHLPVVDEAGRLVGLLTQGGLFRAALDQILADRCP